MLLSMHLVSIQWSLKITGHTRASIMRMSSQPKVVLILVRTKILRHTTIDPIPRKTPMMAWSPIPLSSPEGSFEMSMGTVDPGD